MNKLALAAAACCLASTAALAQAAVPYTQKAGAWWGEVPTPKINEVWMQTGGVEPDATVHGTISFPVTCTLPQPSTLKLTGMVIQVDGHNAQEYYGSHAAALLGQTRIFSVDTKRYTDGWHELRARCYATETAATAEHGHQTQVTNGHQLNFKNGNGKADSHGIVPGIVDSHAWYDSDAATGDTIHYVYVQLFHAHSLIDAPLHGIVPITGRVSSAGATTVGHWVVKVDGTALVEFHDATEMRTWQLDTRMLANGAHTLQFHGHALARSGKQLAAQVEVPIVVAN